MIEDLGIIKQSVNMRYGGIDYIAADAPIGVAIAQYGEWAELEVQLLCTFISPGSSVVDVGANIGTHTLAFARKVGRDGSVLAFEPQRAVFMVLEENLKRNDLAQVRAVQAGVGSVPGEMIVPSIDYNQRTNIGALQLMPTSDTNTGSRTSIVTVDEYNLPRCRLVKIDAEGMDAAVVAGMAETIATLRPVVAVECNDIDSGAAVMRASKWPDYKVFFSRTAAFNPSNYYGNQHNIFGVACESSLLFVPDEFLDLVPASRPGVELILVSNLASLAIAVIETPRFGDSTAYDRNPALLRTEIGRITRENECLLRQLQELKNDAQQVNEHKIGLPDNAVDTASRDESTQET